MLVISIEKLFATALNNTNYKTISLQQAKKKVQESFEELLNTKYKKKASQILRKVDKLESVKEIVLYLGETLLRD